MELIALDQPKGHCEDCGGWHHAACRTLAGRCSSCGSDRLVADSLPPLSDTDAGDASADSRLATVAARRRRHHFGSLRERLIFALAVSLITVFGLVGVWILKTRRERQALEDRARKSFRAGRFEDAHEALQELLRRDPDRPGIAALRGDVEQAWQRLQRERRVARLIATVATTKPADALSAAREATRLAPNSATAHRALALALSRLSDERRRAGEVKASRVQRDAAIRELEHSLLLDDSDARAHWRLAELLGAARRPLPERRKHYDRCRRLAPDTRVGLAARARLAELAGEEAVARAAHAEVLAKGFLRESAIALAELELRRRRFAAASISIDRLFEQDRQDVAGLILRARMRAATGDRSGAIDDFDAAARLDQGSAEAVARRGLLELESGSKASLQRRAELALRLDRQCAVAWSLRGRLRLERERDLTGAREDLGRAVALDPKEARFHAELGKARHLAGDKKGARESYDRALRLDETLARTWANRGTLRRGEGDLAGAVADHERSVELAPDNVKILVQLIRARWAWLQGLKIPLGDPRWDRMESELRRALRLAPERPSTHAIYGRLARLAAKKGDSRTAESCFTRAIELASRLEPKEQSWVWAGHRGLDRAARGDRDGALADFQRYLRSAPAGHPIYRSVQSARSRLAE